MSRGLIARYRVLDAGKNWQGFRRYELAPVMPRSCDGAAGAVENDRYWKATPTGEMKLTVSKDHEAWDTDDVIELVLQPDSEGPWWLNEIKLTNGTVTPVWSLYTRNGDVYKGSLEMGIDNQGAWDAVLTSPDHSRTGMAGGRYTLTMRKV